MVAKLDSGRLRVEGSTLEMLIDISIAYQNYFCCILWNIYMNIYRESEKGRGRRVRESGGRITNVLCRSSDCCSWINTKYISISLLFTVKLPSNTQLLIFCKKKNPSSQRVSYGVMCSLALCLKFNQNQNSSLPLYIHIGTQTLQTSAPLWVTKGWSINTLWRL